MRTRFGRGVAGALMFCTPLVVAARAGAQQMAVQVVDSRARGVESAIYRVRAGGAEAPLGATNASGAATLRVTCAAGDLIRAKPRSPEFLPSSVRCAAGAVQIRVLEKLYVAGGWSTVSTYAAQGNPSAAALASVVLANDLATVDAAAADSARRQAAVQFGKYLGIPNAVIVKPGGAWELSPELTKGVLTYQQSARLPVTGKIDAATAARGATLTAAEMKALLTTKVGRPE
jgi:hypothetical protein